MRKPRKPKKVSYELIDPNTEVGRNMYDLLSDLVGEHHEDLDAALRRSKDRALPFSESDAKPAA